MRFLAFDTSRSNPAETRHLGAGQVFAPRGRTRFTVACVSGVVWVTAGTEDVVLERGQERSFAGPFRVVIQALEPAEIQVRPSSSA